MAVFPLAGVELLLGNICDVQYIAKKTYTAHKYT